MGSNEKTFPAYRESAAKFYVPHYYGVEKYGAPKQYKISEGADINLEFAGTLRDYQEPIVKKLHEHIIQKGGGLLSVPCGRGKTLMAINLITVICVKYIYEVLR